MIYSKPLCKNCNYNFCDFKNFKLGYYEFCSTKCSNSYKEKQEKTKLTFIENYNGYEHPMKDPEYYEDWCNKFFDKYGVYHPPQLKDFDEKSKKTFQKNYNGYNHAMKNPEYYENWIENFEKLYGVKTPFELPGFNDKFVSTMLSNHGVIHPSKILRVKKSKSLKLRERFIPYLYKRLKELNLELLDEKYKHAHFEHNWKCKICGTEFKCIWNFTYLENKCPTCNPRKNSVSKGELELQSFFESLNIDYIANSRQIIKPYELDIFLPEYNVAIEFDGLYWHSDEFVTKNYHKMKTDMCEEIGIRLIHIFEDEWAFKKDLIKWKLKEILNKDIFENVEFNSCIIKEINDKIKDNFIDEYDLRNKSQNSDLNIGCFYKNDLIYVMTFELKDGVLKLLNCCRNYKYSDVKNEMLNHISDKYKVKKFIKTIDRKWNNRKEFEIIGFKIKSNIDPILWLVHDSYKFVVNKIDENNNDRGSSKIWDCGYIELEKSLEQN